MVSAWGSSWGGSWADSWGVDDPPLVLDSDTIHAIIRQWQPSDPFPTQPRYFYNAPAVVVTYVPYSANWLSAVIASWQAVDLPPQQRRPTQIVSVDNPPRYANVITNFYNVILVSWQPPDPWPTQKRPTQIVSVDAPPRYQNVITGFYDVLVPWTTPPDPAPTQKRPMQISSVDSPPRFSIAGTIQIIQGWQPPDPWPQQPRYMQQISGAAVVVTYVPFNAKWLPSVIASWQPEQWTYTRFYVHGNFIQTRTRLIDRPVLGAIFATPNLKADP